ncbi:hypothetical protein J4Z08_20255 [Citrobacter portucalensis]|uniref:hypothetical protein n=1 Tax=Citrobacter portucalensis TaxID=1639133 RepID=UPI003142CFFC
MTTNHPAHGPVSLDRLHQISEILSKAAAQSDGGNLGYAMADAVKVIDGAIAAFGAEPVAYWRHAFRADGFCYADGINSKKHHDEHPLSLLSGGDYWRVTPLYSAPPAPVVPPAIEHDYEVIKAILPTANPDEYACCIASDMWNACRAAMLQAGNHTEQSLDMVDHSGDANEKAEPVIKPYNLPFDQWLSQQDGTIDVDCGCVTTEAFYHWLRVAYEAGNAPVTPDGWVLVPKKITAENGAKSVLSGEFSETKFINCSECFGDDECETCDGSGRIEITVPVSWTNIKAIWAKGVEHFEAAPQQEVK